VSPSTFLETIGSLTVQITLMIGVVAWITCRRQAAAAADWTWTAVHACILLVTGAAFLLPHLRPITWAGLCVTSESVAIQKAVDLGGRFLFWLWSGGVSIMLFALAAGIWRANSLVRNSKRDAQMTQLLLESKAPRLELPRSPIEVRVSTISVSPFCWQLHRPTIVVPDLLIDFPTDEQRAVLNHELVHLAAQHPLCLFLQRIVEAIFWFHPLVWWASRQAAAAREFRCDAQAVDSRQDVAVYLQSLLRLIEARIPTPAALPAGLGFLGDASLLSRRADVLAETLGERIVRIRKVPTLATLIVVSVACVTLWLPLNPHASRRSSWSPWPAWSARVLNASGIEVRDYEVDGHRLAANEQTAAG
jgi:bla regulator protein BlaR1